MSLEPEFRQDPVCGRWTIIAPERAHRPKTLEGAEPRHRGNDERRPCPFCPGQEHETPNEVLAYRPVGSPPDGPGWQLRVVPNKFPAVRPDNASNSLSVSSELFHACPGFGRAEVLIECPEHLPDPTLLNDRQFANVFRAYRDRLMALSNDPQLVYASVFKNVGAEAGASLGHTHSQIIATPIFPGAMEAEFSGALTCYSRTKRCVYCDISNRELADQDRFIVQSSNFLAIAAFAPRFDFEFWVLPKQHSSRYETISDEGCSELAGLMRKVLIAVDVVLHEPAYNWFLHTAPLRSPDQPHFHWHLEVMPRVGRPAGLEWGFGCFVTAVSPEQSARELRAVLAKERSSSKLT